MQLYLIANPSFYVALLAMIAGLRTFNLDTLNFYRESASGINKLAYFLAKDLSDVSSSILRVLSLMPFSQPMSMADVPAGDSRQGEI